VAARKTERNSKSVSPLTLVLAGAVLLVVGLITLSITQNQRPTSIDDKEKLGKIWTTTDTAECREFSRVFAIMLDAAGYSVASQPENVQSAITFRKNTMGITFSEAFDQLFVDKIIPSTYSNWVAVFPNRTPDDLKACLLTSPIYLWSIQNP
jgi:hypothetical protein